MRDKKTAVALLPVNFEKQFSPKKVDALWARIQIKKWFRYSEY